MYYSINNGSFLVQGFISALLMSVGGFDQRQNSNNFVIKLLISYFLNIRKTSVLTKYYLRKGSSDQVKKFEEEFEEVEEEFEEFEEEEFEEGEEEEKEEDQ